MIHLIPPRIREGLRRVRPSRRQNSGGGAPHSEPLRADLFSGEQLQRHARALAARHRIDPVQGRELLLPRLAENERVILEAYEVVTDAEARGRSIAPAAEWLLDNFHVVEQQIRMLRLHLPRAYSRELPRLHGGDAEGLPRVYSIALELISHADGRVDAAGVAEFVGAYQQSAPLRLGELWAVPIMLRAALIENLRRVAAHVVRRRRARDLGRRWAERLLAAAETPDDGVLQTLAALARSRPAFENPFVEEICRHLQGARPSLAIVLSWIDQRLAEQDLTRERLQREDARIQAADQVSIGNSIGSLRMVSATDWRRFVETTSIVEKALSEEPSGVFAAMDFTTRDRYRHEVERLARSARAAEETVARAAVRFAEEAKAEDSTSRRAHVGYWLIDEGRRRLEEAVGARRTLRRSIARAARRAPLACYLGAVSILTTGAAALALAPIWSRSGVGAAFWILLVPVAIAASALAVSLVNVMTTAFVDPRPMPRMDFGKGVPDAWRTIVVVPSLLAGRQEAAELLEGLEIRYLANRDENLFFALLTDFPDASQRDEAGDAELLETVRDGVLALNAKHPRESAPVFLLFHRPRVWNPHERLWMGWERKRGKLEQFNALLRGGPRDRFSEIVGDVGRLSTIRCVLTLDTDTSLPRDAARKLIATMAHPLNRPRIDPATGRVVEGYAVLQPRTPVGLVAASRSRFARLSAGDVGVDPYTREVSDVYQDVFAEGSYVGKGLYDVDAFHRSVEGRFPENLILSHDLIEGVHARSALVSDVELFEDHPASYAAEMSRRHRWIRGDWQIAGWLLPRVPGPGKRRPNPLSALSSWKVFDNLRRSLVPPALLAVLVAGWALSPRPIGLWTAFVVATAFAPVLASALLDAARKPRERTWSEHFSLATKSLGRQSAHAALRLCMLPYRAFIHLDAILVSGVRMLFTRRGLLLWHTPRYAKRNRCRSCGQFIREMAVSSAAGAAGFALLAGTSPAELLVSGPLLFAWVVAPFVGWWISVPAAPRTQTLRRGERAFLGGVARRTWSYFEVFVCENDNWLPPDNFQETPRGVVASRTSPTNVGIALLSNLAAADFGYVSIGRMLERTGKTLASVEKLDRYRGHLYNWYDTKSLAVLRPLYVSSVDSGNLAGCLLTLRAGLWELADRPLVTRRTFDAIADTMVVLREEARTSATSRRLEALEKILGESYDDEVSSTLGRLDRLASEAAAVAAAVEDGAGEQLRRWTRGLADQCRDARDDLRDAVGSQAAGTTPTLRELARSTDSAAAARAAERIRLADSLAQRCSDLAEMDFSFLYDAGARLLSIGYDVGERRLDPSRYDLLASEARLASFILIAQGQLPQEHWFALGRQLTRQGRVTALVSWSGSMFEYLMPLLMMPNYGGTLLEETYRAVVARQIEYGGERGVPWGISESCYAGVDAEGTYQYRAFGVPGLGYKRGLADDLVIAPYASALAVMIAPREASRNLEELARRGWLGAFGFYELVDFTPSRLPPGSDAVVVRAFMTHHQGMSLLALGHELLDRPMQRRFLSDPWLKATELLLHERVPSVVHALQPHAPEVNAARRPRSDNVAALRVHPSSQTPIPEAHLLGNGRYSVMATNAGGGYSRWKDLAVTRWREDATCDDRGAFCYLRDVESGVLWSTSHQPTLRKAKRYEAIFLQGRAEYRRRDEEIDAHTEISVSPEDDVEVRRVTLTNVSRRRRTIEMTSYAEIVLAPQAADAAHPAFSNLFVQTEILRGRDAVLCTRRPREPDEAPPFLFHLLTLQGAASGDASFETDRARFLGRCRSVHDPAAFDEVGELSGGEGSVLDPIVAIRRAVVIDPDTSANAHFITGVAPTREAALALVDRYRDPNFAARAFEMALSHGQVLLRNQQITDADAQVYGRLAASMIHANPALRAPAGVIARNRRAQAGLWAFGVSGDLPILLVKIGDATGIAVVEHAVKAHASWRLKGLATDLVILEEDFSGYRQALHDRITSLVAASGAADLEDKPGGVFVRRGDQMSEEDRGLLQSVARVILTDGAETFEEQCDRRPRSAPRAAAFAPTRASVRRTVVTVPAQPSPDKLLHFNGLGGFTPDGREYVVLLPPGATTPAPWSNVIANERVGVVVTESGGAYTWVDNAHEFRLTPWYDDPVVDPSGEAFYVRDEESGAFWSPSSAPARGDGTYVCRHGLGYSVFEHSQADLESEWTTFVAPGAPVRVTTIRVRNRSRRPRRVSVTGYFELVLGESRERTLLHVITERDPVSGAVFARNPYDREFGGRTAFVHVSETPHTVCGSRTEFLGRNGTRADPAAMHDAHLSGRTGAGLDPCAALMAPFDLEPDAEREIVFLLGAAADAAEAQGLVRRFGSAVAARRALEIVRQTWRDTVDAVRVETPDPALDVLANGWLVYQTLSCRVWGRSGYYQSGGAYGFRDQLQDVVALVHCAPQVAREHLLRCAGRQFREGDVQHWWHPPTGRGVRTRFSDDYLWLPYATSEYVTATGDVAVLDERVGYIEGRPVDVGAESYYDLPRPSEETGTLYEHCARAIQFGMKFGAHGLPLIGCGDWNDAMNLVGVEGRGESVWLAFFFIRVLRRFAELASRSGDAETARQWRDTARRLAEDVELHAWDGAWYRRAFFDDGSPLGSAANAECKIDSIAQSWAVLSGAADVGRATEAMENVDRRLVRRDLALVRLLDPPFDKSAQEPGYIKGYVPGVRENGGQYTHAAVWAAMAFAELGQTERAWELFSMINPVRHAADEEGAARYKVEPYVVAADVYSVAPHAGRGGWTWYTGSAGWMLRLILETLLGLRREGARLRIVPRLPRAWPSFKARYRFGGTVHAVTVRRAAPGESPLVALDDVRQIGDSIPLRDDGQEHVVLVLVESSGS